jgi:hypothetical protein
VTKKWAASPVDEASPRVSCSPDSGSGDKLADRVADTNIPTPPIIQPAPVLNGYGITMMLTITGTGFGSLPSSLGIPTNRLIPYLAVQDTSQRWGAGNSLDGASVGLNLTEWSGRIAVNGFDKTSGNLMMQPGDTLVIWVCNPASGKCDSKPVATPPGTYLPRLSVGIMTQPEQDPSLFTVTC